MAEVKQLDRLTPAALFEIKFPIWDGGQHKRMVGIHQGKVRAHNIVRVLYTRKDGTKPFPDDLYMSEKDVRMYEMKPLEKYPSVYLYWIPIDDFKILERV